MIDATEQRRLFELDLAYGDAVLRTRAFPERAAFERLVAKRGLSPEAVERWFAGKSWS